MLYYKTLGEGEPLVILHGLFGTSDNWRTFAGFLKDHYQVILIDLRNHGRSFWSDLFNYDLLAHDVIEVLDSLNIDKAHLLGHSMGGKTAIKITQLYPERVANLIVVDIGIKQYSPGHEHIFKSVLSINPSLLTSRTEAESILSETIKDRAVRQFLMKSLSRSSEGGFKWKTNFRVLNDQYQNILGEISLVQVKTRTLFVRGSRSSYIVDKDIKELKEKFSNVTFTDLDAGHWVHAERGQELFSEIHAFLGVRPFV